MCVNCKVNMKDQTLLRGVSGGYIDVKMTCFHIHNRDPKKEIPFLLHLTSTRELELKALEAESTNRLTTP